MKKANDNNFWFEGYGRFNVFKQRLFVAMTTGWVATALLLSVVSGTSNFHQHDDVFSATSKLENLLDAEHRGVQLIENYIARTERHMIALKRIVQVSKEAAQLSGVEDRRRHVANPINSYLLLKRLTIDWKILDDIINDALNNSQELTNRFREIQETQTFPREEDLHGAAFALVRLQDVYQLNASALANGQIRNTLSVSSDDVTYCTNQELSARDCLFLGKHSLHRGYYDKAVLWFETALTKAESESNATTHRGEIEPFLHSAIRIHDEILLKHGPKGPEWQTNPTPLMARQEGGPFLQSPKFIPRLYQYQTEAEELLHYSRLCRGERLRPVELDVSLRCRLTTRGHPALLLQPLRVEEMSLDPYIIIIHNFIEENAIQRMIAMAEPKLRTSTHRNPAGGFQKSWRRTSQNAWMLDSDTEVVAHFNRKVHLATGMHVNNVTAAEEYQVTNYGVGGHYVPHSDFLGLPELQLSKWNNFVGDRIATLMVYLSDVEAGGATVFPRAGVTLWPEKGSAAFWWNLYRDGRGDDLTRHGACPVLYGSKWVANKWIRYHDQMLMMPSPLDRNEKLQGLLPYSENGKSSLPSNANLRLIYLDV